MQVSRVVDQVRFRLEARARQLQAHNPSQASRILPLVALQVRPPAAMLRERMLVLNPAVRVSKWAAVAAIQPLVT